MADYDAIVIGAGHNGMVASSYLAKAGLKTLVVEKNSFVGGCASTQEVFPGFKFNLGAHVYGLFRRQIRDGLEMDKFGFETMECDPSFFAPFSNGKYFFWYHDLDKSIEEVKKQFSEKDAEGLRTFVEFFKGFATGLGMGFTQPPMPMGKLFEMFRGPEAEDTLRKILFSPVKDFLDGLIDSEEIKATIAFWAVDGSWCGPMSPGTNLIAGIHFANGEPWYSVKGGIGQLSETLAKILKHHNGELKLSSPAKRLLLEKGKATGVELENGETITAKIVLSNLDPKTTFLKFVGSDNLPADFVTMVRNIRHHTVHSQIFCAVDELPDFTVMPGKEIGLPHKASFIQINPSVEYIERAWDDAKYGRPSKNPVVAFSIPTVYSPELAPPGKHTVPLFIQWTPYDLKEGNWDDIKESVADRAVDIVNEYAPNFKKSIIHRKIFSPLDYERMFGITKGDFWHGELSIEQLFAFRPVPGWSQYRTPIKGLYGCGSGYHPGGAVSGAPGHNAAKVALEDWKK